MIRVDLITGFLGAGKTTFIQKYAAYLLRQGKKAGIVENDYGAVNVDTMLLQELERDGCIIESVAGACDADCHRRRFKTELIALGMSGVDRVLIETDAPYLTPRNVKGLDRTNVPENVKYVAETLAHYMHVSVEELTAAAKANTERVFRIGGDAA